VINLCPEGDHPDRAHVVVDLPRVAAILDRIAADLDELARARRVDDLAAAAVLPGRRAERRRRVAGQAVIEGRRKIRAAVGASDDLGRAAGRPGVGETTVGATRARSGAARRPAHKVSGNYVAKTMSVN
jgi:hypothetical protein